MYNLTFDLKILKHFAHKIRAYKASSADALCGYECTMSTSSIIITIALSTERFGLKFEVRLIMHKNTN